MLDFRRCGDCGVHYPRDEESCPGCGHFGLGPREVLGGRRLPLTAGLPALAAALALLAPQPLSSVLLGAGFTPLIVALAWLLWRRARRAPGSFAARIEDVEARLEELEIDLEDTGRRLEAARAELEAETRPRPASMLRRELRQDRQLQASQRRLLRQLERRLERLEIERFQAELRYFEAFRDARLERPELARELDRRLRALEGGELGGAWGIVLEDARLLQRQLARGVRRLHAARRLDPLVHADLMAAPADPPASSADEGDLEAQTERQLERIERGFEAVAELTAELVGDADASGVRLRVDDEVLAALEEVESEPAGRERISVDAL